jgi:ribosomal protein S18 acetylase RimI-like enzyme
MDIRVATMSDIRQLSRLYFLFHQYHAEGLQDRLKDLGDWEQFDTAQLSQGLEEIIENRKARIFVAEYGESIVGFVEIYLREDETDPATISHVFGHMQSLMVIPNRRKQGIGKRLVQVAEKWAVAQGASEVRLDSWEFAGDPVSFYEGLGYRTLKRKMVRTL